jgi:hypothetical protein
MAGLMPSEESPEAKFDRLKKQLQDSILRDYPNPERKGCPGGAVLRELAVRPLDRAVEEDPHWHHVTHCSECYREFLAFNQSFRSAAKEQRPMLVWSTAVAAVALIVAGLVGMQQGWILPKRPQNAELAYVKRTIVVPSGERSASAAEDRPISLERLPVDLTVELPIGSKAGTYELQLKMHDRVIISAGGNAEIRNGTTAFTARMNLSDIEPGDYSMVIRQVSQDWNLYPVIVR